MVTKVTFRLFVGVGIEHHPVCVYLRNHQHSTFKLLVKSTCVAVMCFKMKDRALSLTLISLISISIGGAQHTNKHTPERTLWSCWRVCKQII